jgi:predicted HTH transcriptional regulator
MSDFVSLNQHQKKTLVIQLYEEGKTRRQIAEAAHMSFKDIADVIKNTLANTVIHQISPRSQKMLALLSYFYKVNNQLKLQ